MTTRAEIITEARSWIGTPYRHQGRLKGVASDCVGTIICVPRALGLFPPDFNVTGYSRNPEPWVMRKFLDLHLDRIDPNERRGGDVLWVIPRRIPQHLAIYTFDNSIIHAMDEERGVREHVLAAYIQINAVYRYRGLAD